MRIHISSDKEWLDVINNERKAEQLNKVSYEAFEIITDGLEKEWFDLCSACLDLLQVAFLMYT